MTVSFLRNLTIAAAVLLGAVSLVAQTPSLVGNFSRVLVGSGTSAAPGVAFSTETTLGFYRVSSGIMGAVGALQPDVLLDKVSALSIADNGAGTDATATLTPTTSYVNITCSDTNGCDITMGESGMVDGRVIRIVNSSANPCNFADTSGVSEISGSFTMSQWDTLVLEYVTDRWVELSRSNN